MSKDLSTMVVSSLISHAEGKKHQKAQESNKLTIKHLCSLSRNLQIQRVVMKAPSLFHLELPLHHLMTM